MSDLTGRSGDHPAIALDDEVDGGGPTTGLERYRFVHQALPQLDLAAVDTTTALFGRTLAAPIVIASTVAGLTRPGLVIRILAAAAQHAGVAIAVGPPTPREQAASDLVQVRELAPDVPVMVEMDIGALRGDEGHQRARQVIDLVRADALVVRVSPLQEALRPDGAARFAGGLELLGGLAAAVDVPVIVKEAGWGVGETTARALAQVGVAGIDVAGGGGTNPTDVERRHIEDPVMVRVAEDFRHWGIPTAEAVVASRTGFADGLIIASGGLRTGLDAATCIALGADAVSFATPLVKAASVSRRAVDERLRGIVESLRIAMFCVGAADIATLASTPHLVRLDRPISEPSR